MIKTVYHVTFQTYSPEAAKALFDMLTPVAKELGIKFHGWTHEIEAEYPEEQSK